MERTAFTGRIEPGRNGGAFVVLPDDVLAALGGGSRFQVTGTAGGVSFERLSFTHRREYVQWIEGAKRDETRARRVAETLERLRA